MCRRRKRERKRKERKAPHCRRPLVALRCGGGGGEEKNWRGKKEGKKRLSVFLYFFLSPPVVILPRKKIIRGEEEEERNGFLVHRCYTEIVRYIHGEKEEKPSVSHTTMGQQKSTQPPSPFPSSSFNLSLALSPVVVYFVRRRK